MVRASRTHLYIWAWAWRELGTLWREGRPLNIYCSLKRHGITRDPLHLCPESNPVQTRRLEIICSKWEVIMLTTIFPVNLTVNHQMVCLCRTSHQGKLENCTSEKHFPSGEGDKGRREMYQSQTAFRNTKLLNSITSESPWCYQIHKDEGGKGKNCFLRFYVFKSPAMLGALQPWISHGSGFQLGRKDIQSQCGLKVKGEKGKYAYLLVHTLLFILSTTKDNNNEDHARKGDKRGKGAKMVIRKREQQRNWEKYPEAAIVPQAPQKWILQPLKNWSFETFYN